MSERLDGGPRLGADITNKSVKTRHPWDCHNRFPLTCQNHGELITVPCGRYKVCPGCAVRKSWELRMRFSAGISQVPNGLWAHFFTLTFPREEAPDEDGAHQCFRSLMGRLRYREKKGAYGWVLQRQNNGSGNRSEAPEGGDEPGTLHFHGILHLTWNAGSGAQEKRSELERENLKKWKSLVVASGFGPQQDLSFAESRHAFYIAKYISSRLARLSPVRRAFSFSGDFPRTDYELDKIKEEDAKQLLDQLGVEPDCSWLPSSMVSSWWGR